MASFRQIQPTKPLDTDQGDGGFHHHGRHSTMVSPSAPPGSSDARPSNAKRARSSHQVAQACPQCRQSKAKCDGVRPRCGNCVAKGRPCGYIGEAGQSRQAAMMARLESLESIFRRVQTLPDDEAHKLYAQIRAADEGASASRIITDTATDAASDLSTASRKSSAAAGLLGSAHPESPHVVETVLEARSECTSQGSNRQVTAPFDLDGSQSPAFTPVLAEIILPDLPTVTRVTDAFFHHSLQPFHVFSRDDVTESICAVYPDCDKFRPAAGSVTIACLAAVAAVGARYLSSSSDKETANSLYQLARYYFESVVEEAPLDAIKCCVLLTACNLMAKSTAALTYIESGLGLAKRQGLFAPDPKDTTLTRRRWAEYRRAWRSLMCLSSWIPFTAGYNEEHVDSISRVYLFGGDIGPNLGASDALQIEMTKISLLKADLLRVRLAPAVIDARTIEAANRDLQGWYAGLPDNMHLGNLQTSDPGPGIHSCICYTHLLHLDAIMLLSRKSMSQFVRAHGYRRSNNRAWTPLDQTLANQAKQGVIAASHSSRILRLLQDAGHVRALSWLLMNQTYTACVILLLSTLQKQMHSFGEAEWADDLDHGVACLTVLETCGEDDLLAKRLHEQLKAMHSLVSDGRHTTSPPPPVGDVATEQLRRELYILTPPNEAAANRIELAIELLNLLCRPFDEASDKQAMVNMSIDPRLRAGPGDDAASAATGSKSMRRVGSASSLCSHEEMHRPGEQRLEDWNFESTLPFRVDARRTTWTEDSGAIPPLNATGGTVLSGGGDRRQRPQAWVDEGDDAMKRMKS